jgi:ABC-type antimicrobial peptide transport system permease subunit
MSVYERRREFGLLMALGMGRKALVAMVLLESFFLALLSAVLGGVLGSAWALWLQAHPIDLTPWLPEGLDWGGITFDPSYPAYLMPHTVVTSMALMVLITLLAALVPSWRTVRFRAAEVLHG